MVRLNGSLLYTALEAKKKQYDAISLYLGVFFCYNKRKLEYVKSLAYVVLSFLHQNQIILKYSYI